MGHHRRVHDLARVIAFVLGVVMVMATIVSVFTSLVVPRVTSSRLLRTIALLLGTAARKVLPRLPSYEAKDRLMSLVGPLAMMLLFVLWLSILLVGFGLIAWWTTGTSLLHAMAISGSSVFTLGIAVGAHPQSEAVEVAAAATGFLVIALEIGYLPTLYAAFSAWETEVTLLATRSGTPAWGPEILARHWWFKTMSELPDLYRVWERWSAEVSESHTNYPSLMWFRSPVSSRSWLLSLVAMLDAAALQDSCSPSDAPRQARIFLRMGMDCLRSLAGALHIPFDPDPLPTTPIRLSFEEFAVGFERLEQVGFPVERTLEESWTNFCGWRINYEAVADALTRLVMPPPAPWLVARPGLGELRLPLIFDRTPADPSAGQSERLGRGVRHLEEEGPA